MEALGAAASVIAVIQLASKLSDSMKGLYKFWTSISGAPGTLQPILNDLKLLSAILADITSQCPYYSSHSTMHDVLAECKSLKFELQSDTTTYKILKSVANPTRRRTNR